jgi:hypothetical protein
VVRKVTCRESAPKEEEVVLEPSEVIKRNVRQGIVLKEMDKTEGASTVEARDIFLEIVLNPRSLERIEARAMEHLG